MNHILGGACLAQNSSSVLSVSFPGGGKERFPDLVCLQILENAGSDTHFFFCPLRVAHYGEKKLHQHLFFFFLPKDEKCVKKITL